MTEIVFSESAYGSLVVGQSYGTEKFLGGATSVIICGKDGLPVKNISVSGRPEGRSYAFGPNPWWKAFEL